MWLDIANHWDISIIAFHNDRIVNFMINIYSDSNQTALHFLSQNVINLDNTIIMTGDFNIRDSNWDPLLTTIPYTLMTSWLSLIA